MNRSQRIGILSVDKITINLHSESTSKNRKRYGLCYLIIPSWQASPQNLIWIMLWGNIFRLSFEYTSCTSYASKLPGTHTGAEGS